MRLFRLTTLFLLLHAGCLPFSFPSFLELSNADPTPHPDTAPAASETTSPEPRSIQVPYFEDGKFAGYTQLPMDADRNPKNVNNPATLQLDKTTEETENPNP